MRVFWGTWDLSFASKRLSHLSGRSPQGDYKGISPLDRSKYILKMRGAIKEAV